MTRVDRRLLLTIIQKYNGGPVGLSTLAAALAEEQDALEEIYEPFLIQIGFLDRTPRGRVATRLAYEHFGIKYGRQPDLVLSENRLTSRSNFRKSFQIFRSRILAIVCKLLLCKFESNGRNFQG